MRGLFLGLSKSQGFREALKQAGEIIRCLYNVQHGRRASRPWTTVLRERLTDSTFDENKARDTHTSPGLHGREELFIFQPFGC